MGVAKGVWLTEDERPSLRHSKLERLAVQWCHTSVQKAVVMSTTLLELPHSKLALSVAAS